MKNSPDHQGQQGAKNVWKDPYFVALMFALAVVVVGIVAFAVYVNKP